MWIMFKILLLALAICVTTAEICEDVDTTACERVKLIRPGMCSEPYMSKQCKKHCGNCPSAKRNPSTARQGSLTCYQCPTHMSYQRACTHTTQCQPGYVCSIKKSFSEGRIYWPLFEMGCMLEQSCSKIGSSFGRRSAFDLTPYCCKNDLCNDHEPLPPTTVLPTIPPSPSSAKRNPSTARQGSLTCYQCPTHMSYQRACTHTTQCQPGYVCSIKKSLSEGRIYWPLIEMGCMLEKSCSKIGSSFGRRSAFDLTPYCCKNDLCNDHEPLPPTTVLPTIPPSPSSAKRNPSTARQGSLTCYQCPKHMSYQRACTNTTQCQPGYVCSIKKSLTGGRIYWTLFEMGCMLEKSCSKIGSSFGRRSAFDLTPYCCKNDLCNDHEPLPPTTVLPTIPPSPYCPSGFQYVSGSCYLVNLTTMTWSQAQDFCRSHDAHLADFTTRYQLRPVIQKAVIPLSSHFQFFDPHCWIDAVYSDSQHHWIWSHSSALVDYRSFTQLAHSTGKTSKCAFASYAVGITPLVFEIDVDCSRSYIPLCEVNPSK